MPRFLVNFPHGAEHDECIRFLDMIRRFGSHWITHAEYGCEDNVHEGWLIVDVDTHEEARMTVPPPYRASATVVKLRQWTSEEIIAMVKEAGIKVED